MAFGQDSGIRLIGIREVSHGLWACLLFVIILLSLGLQASAGSLKPETVQAWDAYVQTAHARMQERLRPDAHFLWIEEAGRMGEVSSEEPYVTNIDEHSPKKVPSGLIHDWVGAVFIPNARVEDVIATVRDYNRYSEYYRPAVIQSKAMGSDGAKDRFSIMMINRPLIAKTALESEGESDYFRLDDRRCYSISRTTHIHQVENYGTPNERVLSEDQGDGLIWRLMSITRYEQRDGGVYMELEAMALSRDIPGSLRWAIAPIVRRVAKSSLTISLQQTQKAVHANLEANDKRGFNERRASLASFGGRKSVSGASAFR